MRTYLSICFALALLFAGFQAKAEPLEGTHVAKILDATQSGTLTDTSITNVQITPHYIGYSRLCGAVYVGRKGDKLGGNIDVEHIPPQPAIHCSAYPQDVMLVSAMFEGADEMRYDPELGLVYIFAKDTQIMVLELLN